MSVPNPMVSIVCLPFIIVEMKVQKINVVFLVLCNFSNSDSLTVSLAWQWADKLYINPTQYWCCADKTSQNFTSCCDNEGMNIFGRLKKKKLFSIQLSTQPPLPSNSRWNQTLISFAINSVSCNHLPLLHHYWSDEWHHVAARDSVFLSIESLLSIDAGIFTLATWRTIARCGMDSRLTTSERSSVWVSTGDPSKRVTINYTSAPACINDGVAHR